MENQLKEESNLSKKINPRIGYGSDFYLQSSSYNAEAVRRFTLSAFEGLWFNNVAENLPIIRGGNDLKEYPKQPDKIALIIGGGPSIENHRQLEIIYESLAYQEGKLFVIACDVALKPCLEKGIYPNMVITMDGTPLTTKFFTDIERIETHDGKPMAIAISAISHPNTVYEAVRVGELWWYLPLWDEIHQEKSYSRIVHWMTGGKPLIQTLGNVGANAIITSLFLGCSEAGFIGIDYGYPSDHPMEKTQYYNAYLKQINKENLEIENAFQEAKKDYKKDCRVYNKFIKEFEEKYGKPIDPTQHLPPEPPVKPEKRVLEGCYRYIINKDTNTHVLVSLNWDVYRNIFLTFVRFMSPRRHLVNLSPESSIFGEGIETKDLKAWLEEVPK